MLSYMTHIHTHIRSRRQHIHGLWFPLPSWLRVVQFGLFFPSFLFPHHSSGYLSPVPYAFSWLPVFILVSYPSSCPVVHLSSGPLVVRSPLLTSHVSIIRPHTPLNLIAHIFGRIFILIRPHAHPCLSPLAFGRSLSFLTHSPITLFYYSLITCLPLLICLRRAYKHAGVAG